MRILITGGTGLVGRALAAELISAGYEVLALSRNAARASGLLPQVALLSWDARTAEGWGSAADGAHAIVHLAAASLSGERFFPSRWTAERRRLIRESRLQSGQAVVEAVRNAEQRPKVVIQISGVGYYGTHGDEALDEDAPAGDDFLAQVAVDWEGSTAAVEALGVRHVVARSGVVLSAEGGALPRLLLPFKLFVGGPMGSGRQWVSWIHPRDHARGLRFLIENERMRGAVNLTSPCPVTNAALGRAVGRVLRRPYFMPLPGLAMRAAFGDVASVVLEGQRVVPSRLQEAGFAYDYPEIEAALRDLLT